MSLPRLVFSRRGRGVCRAGVRGAIVLLFAARVGVAASAAAEVPSPAAADSAVSRRLDELLAADWARQGVEPAPRADDAELLRRLYLDLTGVIPTVGQARAYLEDERPEKLDELTDRLLESPAHATHLADVWRDMLLPRKFDPGQTAGLIGVQNWLRGQFVENRRYDRIVADLLVATGGGESGPALFYTSLGLKPEELAATTARIFLGVRLDCAQCHSHPFDRWTQQDFWGYAAFFARLKYRTTGAISMQLYEAESGDVRLPQSDVIVPTRYLGGRDVDAGEAGTRRQQLAIWMVSPDNPYLARATVNLVWAQLFGLGLVEPVDDLGEHNPASHPAVLAELADFFASNGYDLKRLYRVLAGTRAYQRSSSPGLASIPADSFARMAIKTLSPEQLYDSLARVGLRGSSNLGDRLADGARTAFLMKMQSHSRAATEFDRGVPQALALMNGEELNQIADASQSELVRALDAPFLDAEQRVEAAFLAALARPPRPAERARFVEHVGSRPPEEQPEALGDVIWALLNSAEFALNH